MRTLVSLLFVGLLACSGSTPPPNDPDGATPEEEAAAPSPGAACIAKANDLPAEPADAPLTVTVAHVLIKHRDADRAGAEITRSREEACLRAVEALDALKAGQDFDAVAASYSDEAGADTRGGVIGEVRREEVAPPFAAAAFALEVGQVSYVTETDFGFHIILRSR